MGSKQKQTQAGKKAYYERKLESRLSLLSNKGIASAAVEKDVLVKKLRAHVKAINARLQAIAANEKKTEELAKIKAEKAVVPAAPPKSEAGRKGDKPVEASVEVKEKKKKKAKETAE